MSSGALRLAWWWLAFPPLVVGVLAANPSPLLLALLITPGVRVFASLLKVYAGLPLLGERRWPALTIAAGLGLLTVIAFPDLWVAFFDGAAERGRQLMEESVGGFSAYRYPALLVATLVALAVIARHDLRAAGWLAPVAIWPGAQFHWATLALPVINVPMAMLLALNVQQLPPLVVIGYAVVLQWRRLSAYEGANSKRGVYSATDTHPYYSPRGRPR